MTNDGKNEDECVCGTFYRIVKRGVLLFSFFFKCRLHEFGPGFLNSEICPFF